MPSRSFQHWLSTRAATLDQVESAHQSVHGTGPGSRLVTLQINQAYVVLLSGQFQGFCRELYGECVDYLIRATTPAPLQRLYVTEFGLHRRLDRGNPNPGNIGADFNRLGLELWAEVEADHAQNAQRRQALEEMNNWRNAVAHQDFAPTMLLAGRPHLSLAQVRDWRKACEGLARSFDNVLCVHLQTLTGAAPW
jgi:hypothetical protein